ncbi:MAG: hypothetical protein OHK0029_02830 [Armatimonadaceae bacterium]
MPTYGYRCTACAHVFERFQKITDAPITECEKCGEPVKKLLYPVGIQFKGSGFYVTDYVNNGGGNGSKNGSSGEGSGSSDSDGSASSGESKKDTASETKTESTTTTKSETPAASGSSTK